ncbi:hypothetical protein Bbelb_266420 [Branchiostoma belcheri]|nr:hypothetical protein Bbelb_266420 [Branchiostoma belcheri]
MNLPTIDLPLHVIMTAPRGHGYLVFDNECLYENKAVCCWRAVQTASHGTPISPHISPLQALHCYHGNYVNQRLNDQASKAMVLTGQVWFTLADDIPSTSTCQTGAVEWTVSGGQYQLEDYVYPTSRSSDDQWTIRPVHEPEQVFDKPVSALFPVVSQEVVGVSINRLGEKDERTLEVFQKTSLARIQSEAVVSNILFDVLALKQSVVRVKGLFGEVGRQSQPSYQMLFQHSGKTVMYRANPPSTDPNQSRYQSQKANKQLDETSDPSRPVATLALEFNAGKTTERRRRGTIALTDDRWSERDIATQAADTDIKPDTRFSTPVTVPSHQITALYKHVDLPMAKVVNTRLEVGPPVIQPRRRSDAASPQVRRKVAETMAGENAILTELVEPRGDGDSWLTSAVYVLLLAHAPATYRKWAELRAPLTLKGALKEF